MTNVKRVPFTLLLAPTFLVACGQDHARPKEESATKTTETTAAELAEPAGPPIEAPLTHAPAVPPPTNRAQPAKVVVHLEVREVEAQLSDGVRYVFWTVGGHVPGNFIRVRQGDLVELHLQNHPANKMPHNIDLHAVTGPGGGAASTFSVPGHEMQFTFRALFPGLFVYHCAMTPVGQHIANGMYGLILVEPPGGLRPVDHEFYVMQGEFYTTGDFAAKGLQAFDLDKAIAEKPTYVVFNGADDSLIGDRSLKAKVGETIRLYVGNGGPNLTSSFHVIGEVFDRVSIEANLHWQENVQTTPIPPGSATIVELKMDVPGDYPLLDHAIFRAFNKGALGMIHVEGPEQKAIYSGLQADTPYAPK